MEAPSTSMVELGEQISVVDPRFCFPHPIELAIKRKIANTIFLDIDGNTVFKDKVPFFGSSSLLRDAAGNPLITVKRKAFCWDVRWRAFKGESTDSKHLLFSMKNSPALFSSDLHVFLANNKDEKIMDFKIKKRSSNTMTIYEGQSDIIIAHMSKNKTSNNNILKSKTPIVTIYPGVDSAFIVALILILDEKDEDEVARRKGEEQTS